LSFHLKTHPVLFSFFKKFPTPLLLVGSHMGENVKTDFKASFHPKWEESVFNVRTKSPSENPPTVCLT
jgi:hypothetical protein